MQEKMPLMRSTLKPNQNLKSQKENDNLDIRRGQRQVRIRSPIDELKSLSRCADSLKRLERLRLEKQHLARTVCQRTETVWERLSKAKKAPPAEGSHIHGNPYRQDLLAKAQQRLQKERGATYSQAAAKRILEKPPSCKYNPYQSPLPPILKKPTRSGGDILGVKHSLHDILTPRDICQSKTSVEDATPRNSPTNLCEYYGDKPKLSAALQIEISSDESDEIFESALLIKSPTEESLTLSARLASEFREALKQRHCTMAPDEISLVKNVIKTDKRLHSMKRLNADAFKDALRKKLNAIAKQENVLKTALYNLGNKENAAAQTSRLDKTSRTYKESTGAQKPQVNVIFRNVPSVQKEIVILRALGQKLEATLKRTESLDEKWQISARIAAGLVQNSSLVYFAMGFLQYAQVQVFPRGIRMHIAFVREFFIAKKTITELKNEERQFYLPVNEDHTELRRTSFKRLKQNPKLLMRHLQPKDSVVPFNVLEQDPIFFNSFLYKTFRGVSTVDETNDEEETVVIREPSETNSVHIPYGKEQFLEPLKIVEIEPGILHDMRSRKNSHINQRYPESRSQGHDSYYEQQVRLEAVPSCSIMDASRTQKSKPPKTPPKKIAEPSVQMIPKVSSDISAKVNDNAPHELSTQKLYSSQFQQPVTKVVITPRKAKKTKKSKSPKPPSNISQKEAPATVPYRRRIMTKVTPMPDNKYISPKNKLFIMVCVGVLQVSLFLLMVTAFYYPAASCTPTTTI